jgi:Mg-chelatase subunit ChlD
MRGDGKSKDGVPPMPGVSAPGQTEEAAGLVDAFALADQTPQIDPGVRAVARQISERLRVRKPLRDRSARRGVGQLLTVPYRGGSDEIDLDRTLEVLAEKPVPEAEEIFVRERLRTKRSVVLLVDVSGSMKGERVKTAAATVGALSAELAHDSLAVVAFWSDAAVLLHLGDEVRPMELLDSILRIPARGLTNIAFPLEVAAKQLARVPARDARVVLLSDCVHNAGPDPRLFAGKLPRLDVLLDASGEKDIELGRQLAIRGRGTCQIVRGHRDVAPAISTMFALHR